MIQKKIYPITKIAISEKCASPDIAGESVSDIKQLLHISWKGVRSLTQWKQFLNVLIGVGRQRNESLVVVNWK